MTYAWQGDRTATDKLGKRGQVLLSCTANRVGKEGWSLSSYSTSLSLMFVFSPPQRSIPRWFLGL